jgi:hypothetical protein
LLLNFFSLSLMLQENKLMFVRGMLYRQVSHLTLSIEPTHSNGSHHEMLDLLC